MERPQQSVKTRWRQAECVVNVSAVLEGTIEDWPANIQDGVYMALAKNNLAKMADFQIVKSYSDNDVDTGPYIHVVAIYLEPVQ